MVVPLTPYSRWWSLWLWQCWSPICLHPDQKRGCNKQFPSLKRWSFLCFCIDPKPCSRDIVMYIYIIMFIDFSCILLFPWKLAIFAAHILPNPSIPIHVFTQGKRSRWDFLAYWNSLTAGTCCDSWRRMSTARGGLPWPWISQELLETSLPRASPSIARWWSA